MSTNDEQFFEELAEGSKPEVEAEMAGVSTKPKVLVKKEAAVEEDDLESEPEGQLTIDVYQTGNDIIVESAVAGVEPDDLDIDVTADSVSIKGRRHRNKQVEDEDYFYQECYWGKFARSVILPEEIDPDKATVKFKNGILTIRLPKINKKKAKKLKVRLE